MENSRKNRNKSTDYLRGAYHATPVNTIQAMINKSFAIDYGIIKAIPSDGIVTVETSAAKNAKDIVIITCVLAGLSSSNLTVNVKPVIGDKVIILYPRRYDNKMFNVDTKEPIVRDSVSGYNVFSGIAFLANQCKTKSYKNIITAEDGSLNIKLAYNKETEENNVTLNITKEGNITLSNPKATVTINANGDIQLKAGDDSSNTTVDIKADKTFSVTNGSASIKVGTDNSVTVNGHLKVTI